MGDLDKFIVAEGFKTCPKSNKLPNLVTLLPSFHSAVRFATSPFVSI